jgi:parallel beta-helix repeat protein
MKSDNHYMKRTESALMLMIMLSFSIASASFVDFAKANPPDPDPTPPPLPPSKDIQSDFTFTQNLLNYTLEVQSDNMVIDGAGFSLEGYWNWKARGYYGIELNGKSNITVKNLTIKGFGIAMSISRNSNHITIAGNTLIGTQIQIYDSANNNIINNTLIGTQIQIDDSSNNKIINNTLMECGIIIDGSSDNAIIDNNMDSSSVGIFHSNSNRISNNYFHGSNIRSFVFVYLGTTTYSIISTNVVSSIKGGIYLNNCFETMVIANNITGSRCGIQIAGSLSNNITGNFLYNNSEGFRIRNYMYDDSDGVRSRSGEPKLIVLSEFTNKGLKSNIFSQNDVCSNKESVHADWQIYYPVSEDLLTDWHKMPVIMFGNYWSDYNGTDSDGDGVGDKPYYTTDPFYVDSYPLMVPTYIRNVTITTPKIQTIDELRSMEIASTNFSANLAPNAILFGSTISVAIGLSLAIYFKKRKRKKVSQESLTKKLLSKHKRVDIEIT